MALQPEVMAEMPRDGAGLGAAVAALDPVGRDEEQASQDDLFAQSPMLGGDHGAKLVPTHTRGRPIGSLNKTTEAWRNFILSHYRSPLLFLADLAAVDPFKLADVLECTKLEAMKLVKDAQAELAPYLHRKQPIAIDAGEDKPLPTITYVQVGAEGLARLFPQITENAGQFENTPLIEHEEVADAKSQNAGDVASSD